jgi:hypothetical protein
MLRRVMLGTLACALGLLLVPSLASAQSSGGCQLDGTASFSPGLTNNAQDFSYSFNGDLSGCQSSESGAPASGTVSAGEVVTINGSQYQEPVPTGNGSCGSSTTGGTGIVTWADGTKTVINYTTSGAAAAVTLQGTVVDSVTLQQVGGTGSTTVTTTRYAGDSSLGLLAFEPPDPTACNTPTGVTTAGIQGFVGLGSS